MTRPTFLLAPDSFKESMTAKEVCQALEAGLRAAYPQAEFIWVPMADGGEGTARSLIDATCGETRSARVRGPLGDPLDAEWGVLGDGRTGVVEMAAASGLHQVPRERRDPLRASTYGTGQLVRECLDLGLSEIVVGVGGSATNDGGAGFAQALGARLLDADGHELPPGGADLIRLDRIDTSGIDPRLSGLRVEIACDVDNPLCGPNGASAVYGPQKGADPEQVAALDAALERFGAVVARDLGRDVARVPGSGAGGGLGAGLLAFTDATLRRGVDIVIDRTDLRAKVAGVDLVVTGEGRLDGQTRFGKTPLGVALVAREAGVPVVAIAGCLGDGFEELYDEGFAAIVPILSRLGTLADVLAAGPDNVVRTARELGHLLRLRIGPD